MELDTQAAALLCQPGDVERRVDGQRVELDADLVCRTLGSGKTAVLERTKRRILMSQY